MPGRGCDVVVVGGGIAQESQSPELPPLRGWATSCAGPQGRRTVGCGPIGPRHLRAIFLTVRYETGPGFGKN